MAITLRTVTGSALSYEQVDTNFSSLIHSASISGNQLTLHYTSSGFAPANLVLPITSASFATTSSFAVISSQAISSSFATTAGSSNFSANSIVNLDNSTNVNRFIVFSETANGTPSPLYGEGAITYNPFTNTLTAQTFSGSLSGSAISSSFATTSSMTLAISGSNNHIPVFTGTRTLENSRIVVKGDQVQINPTITLEDSAILQIDSTDRGVLFPRMTSTERIAISDPAEGLIVWDTTLKQLCVYLPTKWYTFDLTAI